MELNEITIIKIIAESVRTDFCGIDIWELCNGMETETITGYRVIFSLATTKEGQYVRAHKYIDIGISGKQIVAQSQTRHSIIIDCQDPTSITKLYEFIEKECFIKRPFRLREYRDYIKSVIDSMKEKKLNAIGEGKPIHFYELPGSRHYSK